MKTAVVPAVLTALAAVFAGAIAFASPLPRGPRSAVPARALPARGVDAACGTGLGSASDLLRAHYGRAAVTQLPTRYSTDVDSIAVLEDDGTFFYTDKSGNVIADPTAIAQAFYRTHGDDYDELSIWLASGQTTFLGSPTALAAAFPLRNDVLGIGLDTYDVGAGFGSPSRLQNITSMNGLQKYQSSPWVSTDPDSFTTLDFLGHEFGHRWLAYILVDSLGTPSTRLLGRAFQHWNFFADVDGSIMEGSDWDTAGVDSFRTVGVTEGYGRLDQYLMGLRPASAVDSFFTIENPTDFQPAATYVPGSDPFVGLGCRARAAWWQIGQVETANGPRVPDAAHAPHAFRLGFILVTPHGADATAADLAKLDSIRTDFEPYFATATSGLGSVGTALTSHLGRLDIVHAPLDDSEDANAPRPIGARVVVEQAGIPIAVDPASVRVLWRSPLSAPFTTIPMSAVTADSFAATLPALPPGATAQYAIAAAADSPGVTVTLPAAGTFEYHVGPDTLPPAIVHAPVLRQGAARLPQTLLARVTDNVGLDSVWVEYAANGGPVASAAVTPAGADSFAAALGAGMLPGQTLAYRFVARDRSAAHNVAYSNPAFDTLRVQQDWADDFENGADGFQHQGYWFSYRDAWHLSQRESSPAAGTAWVCGRDDSLGYPPHLDATLITPTIAGITPGTQLVFDHRWELEQADGTHAYDGARLEASVNGGAWQVLVPLAGYTHQFIVNSNPFQAGTPCWSGSSGAGWRTDAVDLSAFAGSNVRVRFRMLADDLVGYRGWSVDRVRLVYGGSTGVPGTPAIARFARPWPNPARDALHLSGTLPRAGALTWELFDPAGRRVAALWRGRLPAGAFALAAPLPRARAGLYFARVLLDGRTMTSQRVVVVR